MPRHEVIRFHSIGRDSQMETKSVADISRTETKLLQVYATWILKQITLIPCLTLRFVLNVAKSLQLQLALNVNELALREARNVSSIFVSLVEWVEVAVPPYPIVHLGHESAMFVVTQNHSQKDTTWKNDHNHYNWGILFWGEVPFDFAIRSFWHGVLSGAHFPKAPTLKLVLPVIWLVDCQWGAFFLRFQADFVDWTSCNVSAARIFDQNQQNLDQRLCHAPQ